MFSGALPASGLLHYPKSGKNSVIFSIRSLSLSLSLSLALSDWMSALEVEGGEGRSEGSGRMGENESRGRKRGRDGEMEFSGGGERGWVSERDQMQAKRKRKLQDEERVKQLT